MVATNQVDSISLEKIKKYDSLIKNLQERYKEVNREINYTVKGFKPYQNLVPNEIRLEKRIYEVILESVGEKYE